MKIGRTHRSFVSYMDKSREYYRAQGYEHGYAWATFRNTPFQPLTKALSQSRIGVVTTADRAPGRCPRDMRLFAAPNRAGETLYLEKAWDQEATHTDDPETYLPLQRLSEFVQDGRIGSLSERFYGVPTEYSQRVTLENDAPQIEQWMHEDQVDAALLLPL